MNCGLAWMVTLYMVTLRSYWTTENSELNQTEGKIKLSFSMTETYLDNALVV